MDTKIFLINVICAELKSQKAQINQYLYAKTAMIYDNLYDLNKKIKYTLLN